MCAITMQQCLTTNFRTMANEIRALIANEIEVRVGTLKRDGSGASYLLYKDSRCDMKILDEVFGTFNWQREHKELKGVIYCGVSIKSPDGEWVTKWDAGSESNVEKEKGEASDSFKRACTKSINLFLRALCTAHNSSLGISLILSQALTSDGSISPCWSLSNKYLR